MHGPSIGLFPGFQDYFLLPNLTEIKTYRNKEHKHLLPWGKIPGPEKDVHSRASHTILGNLCRPLTPSQGSPLPRPLQRGGWE